MTDTLKKAGYAAIGASANLLAVLRDRIDSFRGALDDLSDRVSHDLRKELEAWMAEGERLIESFGDTSKDVMRLGTETGERVRIKAATARDVVEGIAATATHPIVPIDEVSGIGPKYAARLAHAGVATTSALLERCADHDGARRLAEQTGIAVKLIEEWAEHADLTRIKGIGPEHMETLNAAGIASIEALAGMTPKAVASRIEEAADKSLFVGSVPSAKTLAAWMEEAKGLLSV